MIPNFFASSNGHARPFIHFLDCLQALLRFWRFFLFVKVMESFSAVFNYNLCEWHIGDVKEGRFKKNLFCIFVYDLFVWVLIRLRLINQSNECHDKQRKFPQETHKRWYHSLAINLCVWKISGILKAFMILFSINLFMLSRLF